MSTERVPELEIVHSLAPIATEQLLPISTEQLLYDTYTNRIGDFAGFRQRPFAEARDDFVKTMHEAVDGADVVELRKIIQNLITPESYDEFKSTMSNFWQEHGFEQDLVNYSYCIVTNHRFFSDLPVCAMAMRDIRDKDPNAATRNILVVGKLIPGMDVDIMRNGSYVPVTPLLSLVARQLQSVPKLPKNASKALQAQRLLDNTEFKAASTELAAIPGNIIFEAGSGTQDEVKDKGLKLEMNRVNLETARLLCNPRLKVIPLFFSCNSFGKKGLEPAEAKFKFLTPRIINEPEEVNDVMREIAAAGTELLQEEFPHGVTYAETWRERARKVGRGATKKTSS